MKDVSWLLPEGIDELLPDEARRLEHLRRELLDLLGGWGYEFIVPPFVEFRDSLLTGVGKDLDRQTFVLTDQLSGRLLGVRADMTPQAARIDAHKLRRDEPTRLCYLGSVLRTRPDGFGGSRSPLQIGAELFGHGGPASDVEIVRLMVETLRTAGLRDIYLDLGHVGIYRGLAAQAGLCADAEMDLFDAMQRKSVPEIEALLRANEVDDKSTRMLLGLVDLNGGPEVLNRADELLEDAGADVIAAMINIREVATLLQQDLSKVPLHFDLAELRAYQYQTGVVFAAFVPGEGHEIARGGRYDRIGEVFGRARPATGFSADLKAISRLAGLEDEAQPRRIMAPHRPGDRRLRKVIKQHRDKGRVVLNELPGQKASAAAMGCSHLLEDLDGAWVLTEVTD